jgi:arylsulfatase A-like enzyme/Tfp pilus assembly protein PilF
MRYVTLWSSKITVKIKKRFCVPSSCLWFSFFLFLFPSVLIPQDNPKNGRLNVLLITVDTLRADRLSCYGDSRLLTPNIDQFAAGGTLFTRAFANTTTTLPSHVNILLGTTPLSHGVHDNFNFIVQEGSLTLAEYLKKFGFATGAVIGAYPLDSRFGLDQGFDLYDDDYDRESTQKFAGGERRANAVVDKSIAWIDDHNSPWFLWAHIFDPHDPYDPPEPFRTRFQDRLYDGEVAYTDHELGRLFDHLAGKDLLKRTMIVLTGDHGESLGEHGETTHGYLAYNTTLWIPLIVCVPGFSKGRCSQNVTHIDIFPTVCDALEIEKPPFLQGVSLLPALRGKNMPKRLVYFESLYPFYNRGWAPLIGYVDDQEKFIDSPIPEVYDLKEDFDELRNQLGEKNADRYRKRLTQLVTEMSISRNAPEKRRIDREAMERLRSLGYISSPAGAPKKNYGPGDDVKALLPFFNRTLEAMDVFKKGNTRQGMDMLKEIITAEKNLDLAYSYLASMYKGLGRLSEGIEVLKLGLKRLPESYEIFFTYISFLEAAGRYEDVIQTIDEAHLPQMDIDPDVWITKGNAFLMKGGVDRALNAYKRAQSIDPEYAAVYDGLGKALLSLYDKTKDSVSLQESIAHFAKAVELDPRFVSAYHGLGVAYRYSADLDRAIGFWEKALEINPDYSESLYELGYAYLTKGDKAKALRCLERFRKQFGGFLSPDEKEALDQLIQSIKSGK